MDKENIPTIEDFAAISEDKIRYCDTDRQGHVNNSVFSSLLETGRVEILYNPQNVLHGKNCSFVIASMKLDYLGEITWPGIIKIGTRISRIGKSSMDIQQGLFQDNQCVALAETTIVQVNVETKRSSILENRTIETLKGYMKEK